MWHPFRRNFLFQKKNKNIFSLVDLTQIDYSAGCGLRVAGCRLRAAGCGLRAIYNCCLVIRSLHKKTEMIKFILFCFCFVYNTSTEYDHWIHAHVCLYETDRMQDSNAIILWNRLLSGHVAFTGRFMRKCPLGNMWHALKEIRISLTCMLCG